MPPGPHLPAGWEDSRPTSASQCRRRVGGGGGETGPRRYPDTSLPMRRERTRPVCQTGGGPEAFATLSREKKGGDSKSRTAPLKELT